jgi:nicotinamide riboside kinase
MLKRIAITGPESTGKSWLASRLAHHYQTTWIPEFARNYLSQLERPYTLQDVEYIAGRQFEANRALMPDGDWIFADTEMLVCYIWAGYVFGKVPQSIKGHVDQQQFDFYLLCDTDLPWMPDPLREHPDKRTELFTLYVHELQKRGLPYGIVSGENMERLSHAIQLIDQHFGGEAKQLL